LVVDGVRIEDDGVWACRTQDQFNDAESKFNLRVRFSPRTTFSTSGSTKGNVQCSFETGEFGNCQISFYSYPASESIVFTKDGKTAEGFSVETTSENSNQKVTITSEQVSDEDAGTYQLTVTSSMFPSSPLRYDVTITVGESSEGGLSKENKIIISCCTVGGFFVLLVIFCCVRKNKKKNKKDDDDSSVGSIEDGKSKTKSSKKSKEDSSYANAAF